MPFVCDYWSLKLQIVIPQKPINRRFAHAFAKSLRMFLSQAGQQSYDIEVHSSHICSRRGGNLPDRNRMTFRREERSDMRHIFLFGRTDRSDLIGLTLLTR
jgi:hypothetical protein